jgi:cysteinyl-tRNA synthetase
LSLRLHDTLTRSLREVEPLEPGHVRMYTCGPTVWARAHVGNFRTFLFEDILRRTLEQRFEKVTQVMNITDVDDRLIKNATTHGVTLDEETAPWIAGFFEDSETLGIRPASEYPRATEYVDDMVALIDRLDAAGVTYRSDGSVYFHIADFPEYGRLSGAHARELKTGASGRIDADDYSKEDVRDFALWKSVGPEDIGWDTRIGRGRPGWHLECSAMAINLLGESIDIHGGGIDLIFPHHENEIAQSEAATHRPFSRLWVHGAHLLIDDEKMSKRLANFITVPELIADGYRPSAIRFALTANAHYRKTLNFSGESLRAAAKQVEDIAAFRDRLAEAVGAKNGNNELVELAARTTREFDEALDDDLNLPAAVGHLNAAMREANRVLDAGPVTANAARDLERLVAHADEVMGILPLVDREREAALDDETRRLLAEREQRRAERDFAASDRLRAELRERGIIVDDTTHGQRWRPAI